MLTADELGVDAAHELANERYRLPEVSRTFHARDVFAPAAAHLAAGVALAELGPAARSRRARPRSTCPIPRSGGRRSRRRCSPSTGSATSRRTSAATHIDALGLANGDRVEVRLALDRYYAFVAGTFADAAPGELILYEDSYGLITLAISSGDAARLTGAASGDELRIAVT